MSNTYCCYHIVFRTFKSLKVIDPNYEMELFDQIWKLCTAKKAYLYCVNGMEDHVHLAVDIPADCALSMFVRDLKSGLTTELKKNPHFRNFPGWSTGYFAESHSHADLSYIKEYINNQKKHHANKSFSEEIREIIISSGIELKEEYFAVDWEQ